MYQNLSFEPQQPQQFFLPIKVYYQNGDVKRMYIRPNVSFKELFHLLISHVEEDENLIQEKAKIYYKDNQNDWVVCSSDQEVFESTKYLTDSIQFKVYGNLDKSYKQFQV